MHSTVSILTLASFFFASVHGFYPASTFTRTTTAVSAEFSRDRFLREITGTAAALTLTSTSVLPAFAEEEQVEEKVVEKVVEKVQEKVVLPDGVSYVVTTAGKGASPKIGELAAVRFKATIVQSGIVLDDCFGTPEAYYTRVGAGGLIKGVEEVIPKMHSGDRFLITVPTKMAFGPKGRPASPGKPRIPGDAIVSFDILMESLPGRETELIELIDSD